MSNVLVLKSRSTTTREDIPTYRNKTRHDCGQYCNKTCHWMIWNIGPIKSLVVTEFGYFLVQKRSERTTDTKKIRFSADLKKRNRRQKIRILSISKAEFCLKAEKNHVWCPKPRLAFPKSCVMVFFMFNYLRWELIVWFVDIDWIVDHHCLKLPFLNWYNFSYSDKLLGIVNEPYLQDNFPQEWSNFLSVICIKHQVICPDSDACISNFQSWKKIYFEKFIFEGNMFCSIRF